MSEYYLLTTCAYNCIYETESRPSLLFSVMHQFYQVVTYLSG